MTTHTVANNAQLTSALASAAGGDTIVLQDGHYGNIRVTADYASTVTIRAEHHQDATIGRCRSGAAATCASTASSSPAA